MGMDQKNHQSSRGAVMTTVKDTIRYLGIYQRTIGSNLSETRPMTTRRAHDLMAYMDEGYAAATLMRLRDRGIASEISNGFIRGPRWLEAADYYRWPYEEASS
jgi:hypothetical protein